MVNVATAAGPDLLLIRAVSTSSRSAILMIAGVPACFQNGGAADAGFAKMPASDALNFCPCYAVNRDLSARTETFHVFQGTSALRERTAVR